MAEQQKPEEVARALKSVGAIMFAGGAVGIPLKLFLTAPTLQPGQSAPNNTIAWVLAGVLVVLGVIVLAVGAAKTPSASGK